MYYWEVVQAEVGHWNVRSDFGPSTEKCTYEIMYSKEFDKYKLVCSGFRPKRHNFYPYMVQTLNNYKKEHEKNI